MGLAACPHGVRGISKSTGLGFAFPSGLKSGEDLATFLN